METKDYIFMKLPDIIKDKRIGVSISLWWLVDIIKRRIERNKDESSNRDRQRDKEVDVLGKRKDTRKP